MLPFVDQCAEFITSLAEFVAFARHSFQILHGDSQTRGRLFVHGCLIARTFECCGSAGKGACQRYLIQDVWLGMVFGRPYLHGHEVSLQSSSTASATKPSMNSFADGW